MTLQTPMRPQSDFVLVAIERAFAKAPVMMTLMTMMLTERSSTFVADMCTDPRFVGTRSSEKIRMKPVFAARQQLRAGVAREPPSRLASAASLLGGSGKCGWVPGKGRDGSRDHLL